MDQQFCPGHFHQESCTKEHVVKSVCETLSFNCLLQ